MANTKIDSIKLAGSTETYDIDLPSTATPSIASLTTGSLSVTGSSNLTDVKCEEIEIGKNLEVDGTTKLNGGFEPIHTYEYVVGGQAKKLQVIQEKEYVDGNTVHHVFTGYIIDVDDNYPYYAIGEYTLTDGNVDQILANVIESDTGVLSFYSWATGTQLGYYDILRSDNVKTLFGNQSIVGSGNIDLYNHELVVSGASGQQLRCSFISSKNLVADSVTDLKTIANGLILTGVTTNAPYVAGELIVRNEMVLMHYGDSTTDIFITTVSDKVTTI